MKKISLLTIIVMMLCCLNGCGNVSSNITVPEAKTFLPEAGIFAPEVETLKDWSFQYNDTTNDYSVFFGLSDKHDKAISACINVDIRIENDNKEEIYNDTKTVDKSNFGFYTNPKTGEHYLAEIVIPAEDIKAGSSTNGTVYLTVYDDNDVRFDEVHCSALYCLPVSEIELSVNELPTVVEVKDYYGKVTSKIRIDEVKYQVDNTISSTLKVAVLGEKIYGDSSEDERDSFTYKLFDSEGYVVKTGLIWLESLSQGDKFKDDSILIFDLNPGEKYEIRFIERDI